MRITGGWARGMVLAAPRDLRVRPTSDRVREAVFSALGARLEAAAVLDLYAGTGALGFEALSRGAGRAEFVDEDPGILAVLRRNRDEIVRRGCDPSCIRIVRGDALKTVRGAGKGAHRFDLVFADPPYAATADGRPAARAIGASVAQSDVLASDGLLVLEYAVARPLETIAGLTALRHYRYGETGITFLRREAEPDS